MLALSSIAVLITGFVLIAVFAFGGSRGLYQLALDNISEARFHMKYSQSTELRAQFFSGIREENYQIDGRSGNTIPFALLNIEPLPGVSRFLTTQEMSGVLQIGTEQIEVTLERNQFGDNFAADIGRLVDINQDIEFRLALGTDTVIFEFKPMMNENAIGWEEALRIAVDNFASQLSGVEFEVYIKIITDNAHTTAFWLVQFVTCCNENLLVLITQEGEIINNQP